MIITQYSLVARLKERPCDSDWEKFYRIYENPILAIAAARGLSEPDCKDVLQETMVRMCRHGFLRYDPTRRFTPFLFGIAKDCAVDALRRRSRRDSRELPMNASSAISSYRQRESTDRQVNPAEAAEMDGQRALIGIALDFLLEHEAFAPKTVEIFKALVFEQRNPNDVAKTFDTSRGNVDQAKSTILKKLRPMYDALDKGLDLEAALHSAKRL
ncbi:MAG TPA: sigma-70 family RNA polymerase sigma factor [Candidatus Udaeobacter sp.]|nr:sigma-70 family RNA polymerase sigma factor [Candidatus Udaeobacter sp.]